MPSTPPPSHRRRHRLPLTALAATLAGGALAGACSTPPVAPPCEAGCGDITSSPADARGDSTAMPPGDGGDVTSTPLDGGDAAVTATLAIDPANPTLEVANGHPATQQFHLIAMLPGGRTEPVSGGTFTLADTRLGRLEGDTFTANGTGAGTVEVRAEASYHGATLGARTTLTVDLHYTVLGSLPSDTPSHFDAPAMSDARAARVLYPLDHVVMPANVPPPDVQWEQPATKGQTGDVYRVRVARPHVTVDGYVRNGGPDFTYDWPVDLVAWSALVGNDEGTPAQLTVDRWDATASQHIAGAPVELDFARGQLHGAVYFSELLAGAGGHGPALPRLARVVVDAARHESVVPFPPGDGARIETQALSRDGRLLAGELASLDGAVFDLLDDLSVDPAPTLFPTGTINFRGASFSPDGARLIVETRDDVGFQGGLALIDPRTGARITATGLPDVPSLPAARVPANPAYAPDGHSIAFVDGAGLTDEGAGLGDLAVLPQGASPTAFDAPRVLHHGADLASAPEGGSADAHPSFSPDGRWIAFGHSPQSPLLVDAATPSALYLISATDTTGAAAPIRLDRAMGGRRATDAYYPAFAPYFTNEGDGAGYYWVVFYSTRDYGNDHAGTRGTAQPQLWVAAVRTPVTAGSDPSCVPFWLPGQSVSSPNLAPQWAPTACLPTGTACTALSQCCSGNCAADPGDPARHTCQPPPAMCRARGQTCGGAGECCAGLACANNVCDLPPPG